MQVAERRGQSWRIHITSKARSFNFRFKFKFTSTRFTPNRTLSSFRLSIVLKLRKFILKINSNPTFSPKINSQPSTTKPKNARGFFKAIVMIIVRKFRARLAKIAAKPESHAVYPKVQQIKLQNTIHIIGLWVAGFLASLSQIVLSNGQKGVIMVASMLFKKFNPAKQILIPRRWNPPAPHPHMEYLLRTAGLWEVAQLTKVMWDYDSAFNNALVER